jgi:hypothetical protein
MPRPDPSLDFISQKMRGGNPPTPAGPPPSRDKTMVASVSAKLRGEPLSAGPADWAPTDANAPSDPTDASGQTAENEARDKLGQLDDGSDIIAAIDNPDDELHATAVRLLKAYTALVEQERKKAAGGQP